MPSKKIKTIDETDYKVCSIQDFKHQKELTEKLDNFNSDLDQETINEIVLWKVNRYAPINVESLNILNQIKKDDKTLDKKLTRRILKRLLHKNQKGIGLPVASTILRFKNPSIYQIIDQRVYRYIYGKPIKYSPSNVDAQIDLYLNYLKELRIKCEKHDIPFEQADRLLYLLDKKHNKGINLRGY